MKILADENICKSLIDSLRVLDLEVKSLYDENLAGKSDRTIINHALANNQIILTHDKDFA